MSINGKWFRPQLHGGLESDNAWFVGGGRPPSGFGSETPIAEGVHYGTPTGVVGPVSQMPVAGRTMLPPTTSWGLRPGRLPDEPGPITRRALQLSYELQARFTAANKVIDSQAPVTPPVAGSAGNVRPIMGPTVGLAEEATYPSAPNHYTAITQLGSTMRPVAKNPFVSGQWGGDPVAHPPGTRLGSLGLGSTSLYGYPPGVEYPTAITRARSNAYSDPSHQFAGGGTYEQGVPGYHPSLDPDNPGENTEAVALSVAGAEFNGRDFGKQSTALPVVAAYQQKLADDLASAPAMANILRSVPSRQYHKAFDAIDGGTQPDQLSGKLDEPLLRKYAEGDAAERAAIRAEDPYRPVNEADLYKFGEAVRNASKEYAKMVPEHKNEFWTEHLPQAMKKMNFAEDKGSGGTAEDKGILGTGITIDEVAANAICGIIGLLAPLPVGFAAATACGLGIAADGGDPSGFGLGPEDGP